MDYSSKTDLVSLLVRHLVSGTLRSDDVIPVLEQLVGPPEQTLSTLALIQAVGPEDHPAWHRLREAMHRKSLKDASACHDLRLHGERIGPSAFPDLADLPMDAPLGWRADDSLVDVALRLAELTVCRYFLKGRMEMLPVIQAEIEKVWQESWAQFKALESRWEHLNPDPAEAHLGDVSRWLEDVPEVYEACGSDRAKRQEVLDGVLTCSSDEAAGVILSLCNEPWERERASLVLMLRFGKRGYHDWGDWVRFLTNSSDLCRNRVKALARIREDYGDELRLLWSLERDPSRLSALETWEIERGQTVDPEAFVNRWHQAFGAGEINRLLGLTETPPVLADRATIQIPQPRPVSPSKLARDVVPEILPGPERVPDEASAVSLEDFSETQEGSDPPETPRSSVWHDHIQPSIAENWYLLAGLAMVLVGASLLAYYTWDREWYWRYSVMPALLAMMTMALGRTGAWLEKRSEDARGAGMLLRGAAMALLPVNFMAVALASDDPAVANKSVVVPIMASIYLGLFGWQLRQWCASVLPSLSSLQGGSLLFLNALVAIGPVARNFSEGGEIRSGLAAGFYVGFTVLAGSLIHFARNVLTAELVAEKRVPWFFAGTLAFTFMQVFAWVHWTMGELPLPTHYAVLLILAGGLVLRMERRFLELRPTGRNRDTESFFGYALVLMGVLMGMRQPELRVAVFALAGVVWLRQAERREGLLHYWIGLTLLLLSGVSVGLLQGFPKGRDANWLPWLGLAMALATGLLRIVAGNRGSARLAEAASEFQPALLVLTAVVSVLSQWRLRSAPLETGVALVLTAGYFAYRAFCAQRLGWVHTTMVLLALSLPYFGCVDMEGRSLHGNTMVFGLGLLSALWLLLISARPAPLLIQARSTVLWTLGAFSVAGMLVRVVMEQGTPGDALWYRATMDVVGPFLMAGALVCTAYHSRSLIPSGMAAVILAVLFPELNAKFQQEFPTLGWGTGLGSSVGALGLALAVFRVKGWSWLQDLRGGDLFLGTQTFPLRRCDPTLFVIPMWCTILFLVLRVDLWVVWGQQQTGVVALKTAAALGLTGFVWILLAVQWRATEAAKGAVHASWVVFFLSLHFANPRLATALGHAPEWQLPVLLTGLLLQVLYWVYGVQAARQPWVEQLLRDTTRTVLSGGSLLIAGLCALVLIRGEPWMNVGWLVAFIVLQTVWHGLTEGRKSHGVALFVLTFVSLLSWTGVGEGFLIQRLSWEHIYTPLLGFVAAIEVAQLLLEASPRWRARWRPLWEPFKWGGVGLLLLASSAAFLAMMGSATHVLTTLQQGLLLGTLLLSARANRSGAMLLVGILLGYLFIQGSELAQLDPMQRVVLLLMPWRAALLGLFMAALALVAHRAYAIWPKWIDHCGAQTEPSFSPRFWMLLPSVALACQATAYQTFDPMWRMSPAQLSAPYMGALTLLLVGFAWPQRFFFLLAAGSLSAANVHAVHIAFGDMLERLGLSNIHMVCLGFIATLAQGTAARYILRRDGLTRALNQWNVLLAGLVLMLLAFNYFVYPDLSTITPGRFVLSGLLAWLAGLYFRSAARNPGAGEEAYRDWYEGLYHFGVSLALWCLALLIPALRHPDTVFLALGLPTIYFYARAEIEHGRNADHAHRYLNSATVMSFLLLVFYVSRSLFQMMLFPHSGVRIHTDHYHTNAPMVVALAFLLLRLRGLGGTWWLGFYGGIALIVGSYFSLTAYPGLSPFGHAIPSAWVALALAHLFIMASYQRSPVRSLIQQIAAIDGTEWIALRQYWGRCLLSASQLMVLYALALHQEDPHQVAPLLVGAASVWIHQAMVGRIRSYWFVAVALLALALHADFIVDSFLGRGDVIWVLLGIWAALVCTQIWWQRWAPSAQLEVPFLLLFVTCACHVIYHHPASDVGLAVVAIMAMLGMLTPCATRVAEIVEVQFVAGLPLLAVPWLVYFSQARLGEKLILDWTATWPVVATTATIFATGVLVRLYEKDAFPFLRNFVTAQPRLFHRTLAVCAMHGSRLNLLAMGISFFAASLILVTHYGSAYEARELVCQSLLWTGLAAAWYDWGIERRSMLSQILAQLSVLGLFAVLRRQLMLTTQFWTPEYDVWCSLAVSCCIAGAKQHLSRQSREVRVPMMGTLFALPVVAVIWTVIHNLGTDITLVIVGLHSLTFAFLGRDERESPYNMVAILGSIAFVIILLWHRLEFRFLHAIVIPSGVGVLALLHVSGGRLHQETKEGIRWLTLCAMLGSTGYHALADGSHPIGFNLTMMILCLSAMALGTLLKVRLYLFLGFAGLIVDLLSIVYKVLLRHANIPMTAIGMLILLLGASLVVGSVYCKTHRDEIEAMLARSRARFGTWQ